MRLPGRASPIVAVAVAVTCASAARTPPKRDLENRGPWVREVRVIRSGVRGVNWNHRTNLIAYEKVGADGYYDVHLMRPDGTHVRTLTEGHRDLPNRGVGAPSWHPSGEFIALQVEKAQHRKPRVPRTQWPGAGVYQDLWVLVLDTNRAYPLRVVPDGRGHGVLQPHFSPDGRKLAWSEMYAPSRLIGKERQLGLWKLMVADFVADRNRPRLENIRAYEPGKPAFYENHGFSPDGDKLLFSASFEAVNRLNNHIYVMDLRTQKVERLTDGKEWNEHARFSPDGAHIVWMRRDDDTKGTDYWLMRSDGSGKRRLTFFNEKGHPHYAGDTVVVADCSWSPDGHSFVGYQRLGAGFEQKTSPMNAVLVSLDMPRIRAAEAQGR